MRFLKRGGRALAFLLIASGAVSAAEATNSQPSLLLEGGNAAILATRSAFQITYSDEVTGAVCPSRRGSGTSWS